MVVVQFVEPAVNTSSVSAWGATAITFGATFFDPSAFASASVSVLAVPKPPRTPLELVVLPGVTTRRFDPSAEMAELTLLCAPSPRPTVRMTAAIPSTPERRVSRHLMPRPRRIRAGRP